MTGTQIKRAYITSKALYDKAITELDRRTAHLPYDDPDRLEEIVGFEMQVREDLNLGQLRNDLKAAEKLLLDWAKEKIATHPLTATKFAAMADDLEKVFTSYRLDIRRKIIDLSLRLEE